MNIVSLIFGQDSYLKIADFNVDVSLSETHSADAEVTDNPVEAWEGQNGVSNVTDHINLKPLTLAIEGIHSDTPIKVTDIISLAGVGSAFTSKIGESRAGLVYTELMRLRNERQPFSVVTGLRSYDNMVVQKITVPRDPKIGRAVKFSVDFRQITRVTPQTVHFNSKFAKATAHQGKKATKTVDTGKRPSAILSFIRWLTG